MTKESSLNLIDSLSQMSEKLGSSENHILSKDINGKKDTFGVISYYSGVKPSHLVLEELYEWAEENNKEVKELIEKLSEDLSFSNDL